MTTLTAWLTTNDSLAGADSGISISESELLDGYRDEKGFVAHSDTQDWVESASLFPEADDVLETMGYHRTGTWTESGGQWAAEVEKR